MKQLLLVLALLLATVSKVERPVKPKPFVPPARLAWASTKPDTDKTVNPLDSWICHLNPGVCGCPPMGCQL